MANYIPLRVFTQITICHFNSLCRLKVVPCFGSFHNHKAYRMLRTLIRKAAIWQIAIKIHISHNLNGGVIDLAGLNNRTKALLNCYGKYIRLFVDLSCLLLPSCNVPRVNLMVSALEQQPLSY